MRILLAGADRAWSSAVRRFLRDEQHLVKTTHSSRRAKGAIEHGEYDLVIIGGELKGVREVELFARVLQASGQGEQKRTKILAAEQLAQEVPADVMTGAEILFFPMKSPEEIHATINSVLYSGRRCEPRFAVKRDAIIEGDGFAGSCILRDVSMQGLGLDLIERHLDRMPEVGDACRVIVYLENSIWTVDWRSPGDGVVASARFRSPSESVEGMAESQEIPQEPQMAVTGAVCRTVIRRRFWRKFVTLGIRLHDLVASQVQELEKLLAAARGG